MIWALSMFAFKCMRDLFDIKLHGTIVMNDDPYEAGRRRVVRFKCHDALRHRTIYCRHGKETVNEE